MQRGAQHSVADPDHWRHPELPGGGRWDAPTVARNRRIYGALASDFLLARWLARHVPIGGRRGAWGPRQTHCPRCGAELERRP